MGFRTNRTCFSEPGTLSAASVRMAACVALWRYGPHKIMQSGGRSRGHDSGAPDSAQSRVNGRDRVGVRVTSKRSAAATSANALSIANGSLPTAASSFSRLSAAGIQKRFTLPLQSPKAPRAQGYARGAEPRGRSRLLIAQSHAAIVRLVHIPRAEVDPVRYDPGRDGDSDRNDHRRHKCFHFRLPCEATWRCRRAAAVMAPYPLSFA
jgi:hypothetical protein